MFNIRTKLLLLAACSLVLLPAAVRGAGLFTDVSDRHPHKDAIESLARADIVKGTSAGIFDPDRNVNRAEFLTLLYRATDRSIPTADGRCFSDVERGSWYEGVVCDAAKNGFVQGYSDGKFRPGSPVTRTEALKMIFTVFGLPVQEITEKDRGLIKFVDVSVAAWYTKYVIEAFAAGVLPIPGQTGTRFYPDKELLRSEAAAYIFNAMNARIRATSSSSSSSSTSDDDIRRVAFPFTNNGVFTKTKPIAYVFDLKDARTVVKLQVTIVGFYTSEVTCRLYKLEEGGFSGEYYLGAQTQNSCMVVAAVPPGSYQFQIQPTVAGAAYIAEGMAVTSDGNDGFMDAVSLSPTAPRTAVLEANDMYDWYSFNVEEEMIGTITAAGSSTLSCIIYTPLSVDQFGFTGPECNKPYVFQHGEEYMVGVGRIGATDLAKKVTYTVKWQ